MSLTLNTLLFSSDDEDDEGPHSAEDDDVDLGDSVTDGSEEDDAEEESDEASGSDEEESGVDSEEDSDSGPDLARGKGNIETSSDEDDDDDEVDSILRKEEEEIEHDWGELCKDAPRSSEVRCGVACGGRTACSPAGNVLTSFHCVCVKVSARLAVCNMDWDRLKAKDLLALLNSFTPNGGAVLSVKVKLL